MCKYPIYTHYTSVMTKITAQILPPHDILSPTVVQPFYFTEPQEPEEEKEQILQEEQRQ